MQKLVGFLILLVYPIQAWSKCVERKPPRLVHVEIQSCEAAEEHTDLLVEGTLLEFFELNKPLEKTNGNGEVAKWVYYSDGSVQCASILGTSVIAREQRWCCDVLPHRSLECKTGRPTLLVFEVPPEGNPVNSAFIHRPNQIATIIGQSDPFTGRAVKYHRDTGTVRQEIDYVDGRIVWNASWNVQGWPLSETTKDTEKEVRRNYHHSTDTISRESTVYFDKSKLEEIRIWDRSGNYLGCTLRVNKAPCPEPY